MAPRRRSFAAVLAVAATTWGACGGSDPASSNAAPKSIEEALGVDEASMEERQTKVQEEVRRCMQAQGFEYVPIDPSQLTVVRIGPGGGNDDEEFRRTKGYGITTVLGDGLRPAGGEGSNPNQRIREALSEEERTAYDRALFGRSVHNAGGPGGGFVINEGGPSPAGAGEVAAGERAEGGCLQTAQEKVGGDSFERIGPQLQELEERVRSDPRLVKVDAAWSRCMAAAGYDFERPEDIPPALFERMNELMRPDGDVPRPPDPDDPALAELQRDELAMARADDECSARTGRGAVAEEVRAEAERRFLEENPDFGADRGEK